MAKFIITPQPKLEGVIEVSGAKNAAIILIAGSLLMSGETILENVPDILDIQKIISILEKLGVKFLRTGDILKIDTRNLKPQNPDPLLVGEIRASIVLVGPLLARFGKLKIPHPGGCLIGPRPIDEHLRAFCSLGVKIKEENGFYEFTYQPSLSQNSTSKNFRFKKISVTATENILLFAAIQKNQVVFIENAAIEPEVIDLIEFLKMAGGRISVQGRLIKIFPQKTLKPVTYRVIPDRIEAGTFAIMAAAFKCELKILNVRPKHLVSLLEKFQEMGIEFVKGKDFLYIKKPQEIRAINIATAPYPGFPTDLQPPMGVLLTQAQGLSHIRENIFENRLGYLKELEKMGAQVKFYSSCEAEITGPTELSGAKIESLDLRAGATLLIAGLIAKTPTEINHAENIDRGYERIEEKLSKIGAKIKRIQ